MRLFRHAGLEEPAPYLIRGIQTSSRRKSGTISKTRSRFSPGALDSGFRRNDGFYENYSLWTDSNYIKDTGFLLEFIPNLIRGRIDDYRPKNVNVIPVKTGIQKGLSLKAFKKPLNLGYNLFK